MSDHPQKFDALKTLYDGQLTTLRSISERAFTTTMQAIALNVAVVAGLMGSKIKLSPDGKNIGTKLILVFSFLVVFYLVSKARAHHREKMKFIEIQSSLAEISNVNSLSQQSIPSFWKSFFGGTAIFILSVGLAGACTISAMRSSLLLPETTNTSSVSVK